MVNLIAKAIRATGAALAACGLVWLPIAATGETIRAVIIGGVWGLVGLFVGYLFITLSFIIEWSEGK